MCVWEESKYRNRIVWWNNLREGKFGSFVLRGVLVWYVFV